jgi:hypothetical protein
LNVEAKRLKILEMDLHPISTHFSVGGATLLTIIFMISLIWPNINGLQIGYGGILDFFAYSFPIFVFLTMILGIMDGKLRYKKLQTDFLRRKIILGSTLLVASISVVIFHYYADYGLNQTYVICEAIFILISLGAALMLGMIGAKLMGNIVPKGHEVVKKAPESSESSETQ